MHRRRPFHKLGLGAGPTYLDQLSPAFAGSLAPVMVADGTLPPERGQQHHKGKKAQPHA